MIKITVNKADYEYDIYSLVQAFFPGEELYLDYQIPEDEMDDLPYQVKRRKQLEKNEIEATHTLEVIYGESQKTIYLKFYNSKDLYGEKHIEVSNPLDRPTTKNQLKQSIYELLSQFTEKKLPWGTLTGIRPTKLALTRLSDGENEKDVRKFMSDVYLCSDIKTDLSLEISKREIEILSELNTLVSFKKGNDEALKGYSIYIGIPFCPTTCLYCSFPSYTRASFTGKVSLYLEVLKKEILETSILMKDKLLDTVYIGGGTPTALSHEELRELFSYIYEVLPMDRVKEFNVEAGRPDSITREKLQVMKDFKVNRISINPQTMHQKTLRLIGRHHTI
jgi:oxygen-independent coproporphyrinogen-3 oxidase